MLSTEEHRQPHMAAPAVRLPYKGRNLSSASSPILHAQQHARALSQDMDSQDSLEQHIWVVTGPAGCGKTTVAEGIAEELSLPYVEGDDYHSKNNKEKMARNIPLTDADRWDWLISLREAAVESLSHPTTNDFSLSKPTTTDSGLPRGVVVTCSALKRKYRDVMRVATYNHRDVIIHFIYLRADESVLLERVNRRKDHYMKPDMVHSQLETLEEPDGEWDALTIDVAASPKEVLERALQMVLENLASTERVR